MKTPVRKISLAFAASALISSAVFAAPTETRPTDGQAQAATLLSREWTPVIPDTRSAAQRVDAQARAAALLSRPQTESAPVSMSRVSQVMPVDGQTRAAALLSRGTI